MAIKIKAYSAKQVAEKMGLRHTEVIRRIRKNDIEASKMGWFYVITEEALEEAMNSEWYKQYRQQYRQS